MDTDAAMNLETMDSNRIQQPRSNRFGVRFFIRLSRHLPITVQKFLVQAVALTELAAIELLAGLPQTTHPRIGNFYNPAIPFY